MFKLTPRLKPNYTFSDWIAVLNIFQKNPIESYEKEFANKFENEYGVMFQHGRSGLYALLKVWGLENDEVICPAYTCVVVPNAIVLSGNIPVFVDSSKESFNMDLELLENSITEKTKAIVVTHIFGYPMDVLKVQEMVKNAEQKYGHKIYVIQDAAHSYGARWQGELVTKYGDAAIFGSNISKIINSIFGGMIITNSKETFDKLKSWRKNNTKASCFSKSIKRFIYFVAVNFAFNSYIYGFVNWLERIGALDRFVKYFEEDKIYFPDDWDIMPSNIEARVGRNQLKKYKDMVASRKKYANLYGSLLKHFDGLRLFVDIEGATYSQIQVTVKDRKEIMEYCLDNGIQLGEVLEYSIPYMSAYQSRYDIKMENYKNSYFYSKNVVNLPVSGKFNQKIASKVVSLLGEYFEENSNRY